MKRYRVTAEARRDLRRIVAYIAEDSPEAARRVAELLAEKFSFLAGNPGAGRIREDVRHGYRSFPVFEYLIFYRIQPPGVQIVHIVHGRRDLPRLLN